MLLLLVGCSRPSPPPPVLPVPAPPVAPDWFEDRSPTAGIDFAYRNGEESDQYTILESLGGGGALFDFDGDGKLDIFLTGGGHIDPGNPITVRGRPSRLYRNLGNWKFEDVTAAVGLDRSVFYSHGAAVGDFDRDGWPDLFVSGYGRSALYANRPAAGDPTRRTFVDVTPTEIAALRWATSAAFADLNGDGWPELFVCQYLDWSPALHRTCPSSTAAADVCTPHAFRPLRPVLFHNRNGRFEDVSAAHGLKPGKGLGVLVADLDGDARPDVYVANDAGDNHFYRNRPGFQLEECGLDRGVAVDESGHPNGSMGVAVADWDRTGRPAVLVTNYQNEWHALYQGVGGGRFRYASHPAGLTKLGQAFVGFGAAFTDFDADGWEDAAIANGHVLRHPAGSTLAQLPVLLRNTPAGSRRVLENVSATGGSYFRTPARGRGLAVGDLDNDGRPDVVVTHQNAPPALLRNADASGRQFIRFRLRAAGHRSLVGAQLEITAGGVRQTRFLAAGGYLSEGEPVLHVGLDRMDRADAIRVVWPFGGTWIWDRTLAAGRTWTIDPGRPDPY